MSKHIRPSVPLDALGQLVKERRAVGERSISVPFLLRWLDLEERLVDIWLRIGDTKSAIARGDLTAAGNQLELMESDLRRLVDLP